MEAINFIADWINYMFIIIPVATILMITYESLKKAVATDEGEINDANKKIKTTLKAAIIGISISGLIDIIKAFY